jgi:ubiquinone/menaquinone biosynthesis C-methylase UbiE
MSKFDSAEVVDRIERMYSSPPVVAQRTRTRAALAIRPGEQGLDIGCGMGLLSCEMAREVGPSGRISGIDGSERMIAAARRRAEREQVADRVTFTLGDAGRLEFASATFDFAVAVQVYLYVANIERALAEAARVLRPGGRLAIVDTDWDSCVWLTSDRERHRRMLEARMQEFAQPHLPPALPGLIRRARLDPLDVQVLPLLELRHDPDSFSAGVIDGTAAMATRFGIEPAEAEAWSRDLKSRTGEGEYFFSVNRYLFLARRS